MLVANIMNVEFGRLLASESALDAIELCRERRQRLLPVVDDADKLIGVVSVDALVRAAFPDEKARGEFSHMGGVNGLGGKKVADIMDRDFSTLLPDAPASKAASVFIGPAKRPEAVFVIDNGGRLIGVVTIWDFLNRVAAYAGRMK